MKVFLSIVGFTIALLHPAGAQSYRKFQMKGDSCYVAGNYASAMEWYEKAFQVHHKNVYDLYHAAGAAAMANNYRRSLEWLEMAYDQGWDDIRRLQKDKDFGEMRKMPSLQAFMDKVKHKTDTREATYDKPLRKTLLDLLEDDKRWQQRETGIGNQFGWASPQMDSLHRLMQVADSINLTKICQLIDQNGWIAPDKVGKEASLTQYLILEHGGVDLRLKYLPLMREAAQSGKLPMDLYCMAFDRLDLDQGRKQTYGTQIRQNSFTGAYYVAPVEDPQHVDQRRASVGLEPMADYVLRWNIVWNGQ